ncbi:molybdopterin-dependent oxidoreductase [Pseudomaricurvus alkylphenolicus]|uniref:molybdopterin cofactor-binding domain-containing protein n=1 Tax=Pseudomaricurvus alkylphenolicus TaxID=1306991 RepID=UPI00141E231D|nr:molybdopterin cofactor-binding domain-containing protein [Pseudomaricurvus alkylphenolicus]NIB42209.1 molybdopterin-dependent oxidoreductase [Pseudomaricurvus alkylphenolicus]
MSQLTPSRRNFLKLLGFTGGGLVLGVPLVAGCAASTRDHNSKDKGFTPSSFLQITEDNEIHFYLPQDEMGQGIYTGLTTLVAEELEVNPEQIQVHFAPPHKDFRNLTLEMQLTGGSNSISAWFRPLRQSAANARELIRNAAAQQLNAPVTQLQLQEGQVSWRGKKHPYGDFAALAGTLPVVEDAPIKKNGDFRHIGKSRPRLDGIAKSTGTAVFGIDIDIPNLYRAVVVRSPVHGGIPKQFFRGSLPRFQICA